MKKISFLILGLFLTFSGYSQEKEHLVEITFDKLGALYHKNQDGWAVGKVMKAKNDSVSYRVVVEVTDIDEKPAGYVQEYTLSGPFERYYYVPLQMKDIGYYYVKISFLHDGKVIQTTKEGFGVIPDVTLTKKDSDSPFGVGAHYSRYGDWRVADIQQQLGIAWVRDVANWKKSAASGMDKHDPFIDYLDAHFHPSGLAVRLHHEHGQGEGNGHGLHPGLFHERHLYADRAVRHGQHHSHHESGTAALARVRHPERR